MKASSFLRLLVGAGLAVACAVVPLWPRGASPEKRRLVFVLPNDFHGPYECDDPGALWLWQREFGVLAMDDGLGRADAMERTVRVRFKTRERDAALVRLRAIPAVVFEPAGTDGVLATLQDPPEDLTAFEKAVGAACPSGLVDWSVEISSRPRIEARFVFCVLPEARRYARTPTPAQQVERHLEQHGVPDVVLKFSVLNEDHLELRTRHGGTSAQLAISAMCPGVFDFSKSTNEAVPTDREERVVTATLPADAAPKVAVMELPWSEFAFTVVVDGDRAVLTWVDPPDWKIVEAKVKSLAGVAPSAPAEAKRPRTEHRWNLQIDVTAKLPGGRPVKLEPPSPAYAVRRFLETLQRKGPLASITEFETVDADHLAIRTRRPGPAFVKAVLDACPGAFDPDSVQVEQFLLLRARRAAGDPALMVDVEATLDHLRLAHGITIFADYWTQLRIAGSPMKASDAAAFLEKTVPESVRREVRVVDAETVEVRERFSIGGVLPYLNKACPGRFKPAGTRIVLRTSELSYRLFERCSLPLAGSRTRVGDLRSIWTKQFWVNTPDRLGDVEQALRDGTADAAVLVDPPSDLPAIDLRLRMTLAAVFSDSIPRDIRMQLRTALAGKAVLVDWRDVRILCRRGRRVSREQAMVVAERLRACGVRGCVEAEKDFDFERRLAKGDYDLVVDAFPESVRWRAVPPLAGGGERLRILRAELDETFDLRARAQLRHEISAILDQEGAWIVFGEVPVKLCGTRDALRRLGYPLP